MAMKHCRHGTFVYNLHDLFVGRSLDHYGQWCEQELKLLAQVVKPTHVVIDVGANIGTHTVFFARQVTDQGGVVAFEPQRLVFQNLCANVALNALTNVMARQQGVGSQTQTVNMPLFDPQQDQNFGAAQVLGHATGEPLQIIRLDDVQLTRCNLIKIDVEGMECDVLEGARQLIGRQRPVLFVENNTLERSAAIIGAIESLDYDAFWHVSNYFEADNYLGSATNIFENIQPEANLLCFHRSTAANIQGLPKVTGVDDNWRLAVERLART